jgi:hypothetical protein
MALLAVASGTIAVAVRSGFATAVLVAGPGDPPSPQALADDLADRFGSRVELDLQWIPRQRVVVSGG